MKTIRVDNRYGKVVAFTNGIISYGKSFKGNYRIELNLISWLIDKSIPLYISKKKPLFRNITILAILLYLFRIVFSVIGFVLVILLFPLVNYLEGAKNFIKDCAWVQNVRFFNWVNFIGVIILAIILILK